MYRSVADQLDR